MSVNIFVVGFRPPDDVWRKHKAVWDACDAAGVEIPDATLVFFGYEDPGDKPGMTVKLGLACAEYRGEDSEGYEIDITKLPPDVRIIRAYLS